jgi:hypothetical protein
MSIKFGYKIRDEYLDISIDGIIMYNASYDLKYLSGPNRIQSIIDNIKSKTDKPFSNNLFFKKYSDDKEYIFICNKDHIQFKNLAVKYDDSIIDTIIQMLEELKEYSIHNNEVEPMMKIVCDKDETEYPVIFKTMSNDLEYELYIYNYTLTHFTVNNEILDNLVKAIETELDGSSLFSEYQLGNVLRTGDTSKYESKYSLMKKNIGDTQQYFIYQNNIFTHCRASNINEKFYLGTDKIQIMKSLKNMYLIKNYKEIYQQVI